MLRRGFLLLAMGTALGSTGCAYVLGAIFEASVKSAARGEKAWSNAGREDAPPVEWPVDRAMTACELERGRWREAHQDQDEIPPELSCLADGSYPKVAPARGAAPPAATAETGVPSAVEAPADAQAPAADQAPADTI